MTAEIAIMNKMAVALAADSAVTLTHGANQKIYKTVNKLFAISRRHPVGIMIYGNAQLMGLPWETVIKSYRKTLGTKAFPALDDYVEDFVAFLESQNGLLPSQHQRDYYMAHLLAILKKIVSQVKAASDQVIKTSSQVTEQEIKQITRKLLKKHHDEWANRSFLCGRSAKHEVLVRKSYGDIIARCRKEAFGKLPLSAYDVRLINSIAKMFAFRDLFANDVSGLVFAGFGDAETFPSVIEVAANAVFVNRLRYKVSQRQQITYGNSATVMAFAQKEMVATFMEGIDPFYKTTIQEYLIKLLENVSQCVNDAFDKVPAAAKADALNRLREAAPKLVEQFVQQLGAHAAQKHVSPIVQTVTVLPLDELAAMAEALVNLTSFKRRITITPETVAGPIDVAVVSKGDGFVWAKRKRYFDPTIQADEP